MKLKPFLSIFKEGLLSAIRGVGGSVAAANNISRKLESGTLAGISQFILLLSIVYSKMEKFWKRRPRILSSLVTLSDSSTRCLMRSPKLCQHYI